jgi:hypothetical protein
MYASPFATHNDETNESLLGNPRVDDRHSYTQISDPFVCAYYVCERMLILSLIQLFLPLGYCSYGEHLFHSHSK